MEGAHDNPVDEMVWPADARWPLQAATPVLAHWLWNRMAAMEGMHGPHMMGFHLPRSDIHLPARSAAQLSLVSAQHQVELLMQHQPSGDTSQTLGDKLINLYRNQMYSGHKFALLSAEPQLAMLPEGLSIFITNVESV